MPPPIDDSSPSILDRLRVLCFFVTTRCNSRCATCFYHKYLNDTRLNELTLEEIGQIASTMPPFPHLLLSGGEPTLRKDILPLIGIFARRNRIQTVDLPTNGLMPERIREIAGAILDAHPDIFLTIGVSLDGRRETHDRIRGVPGNFDKVRETLEAMGRLRRDREQAARQGAGPSPRLQLVTLTALQESNFEDFLALLDEFPAQFDLDGMSFETLRATVTRDGALRPPSPAQHAKAVRRALEVNYQLFSRRLAAERPRRLSYLHGVYRVQKRILRGGAMNLPCQAGVRLAVLEPDGRVRLCEFFDPIGSLRDHGLNWPALWLGPEARAQRKHIRETKCSCTHCVNLGHSIDDDFRARLLRRADEIAFSSFLTP